MRRPAVSMSVVLVLSAASGALAQVEGGATLPPLDPLHLVVAAPGQPAESTATPPTEPRPADSGAASEPLKTPAPAFGTPGSDWMTLSLAAGDDFNESTDFSLSFAWSRFIVRDVEFGVDVGAWYFDQEQDPALGLSATPFLRWHFVSRETWSIFTDAGIGLCVSSNDVPDDGTSFNFAPRAGFGATFRLAPDDTRLEVGARWQHFSNARITGDAANPGRDEPMIYIGIIFPF